MAPGPGIVWEATEVLPSENGKKPESISSKFTEVSPPNNALSGVPSVVVKMLSSFNVTTLLPPVPAIPVIRHCITPSPPTSTGVPVSEPDNVKVSALVLIVRVRAPLTLQTENNAIKNSEFKRLLIRAFLILIPLCLNIFKLIRTVCFCGYAYKKKLKIF